MIFLTYNYYLKIDPYNEFFLIIKFPKYVQPPFIIHNLSLPRTQSPYCSYPLADIFLACFSAEQQSPGFCNVHAASGGRRRHVRVILWLSDTGCWKPGCLCRSRKWMVLLAGVLRFGDFLTKVFSLLSSSFFALGPDFPSGSYSTTLRDLALEVILPPFQKLKSSVLNSPSSNLNFAVFSWNLRKSVFSCLNYELKTCLFIFFLWCWQSAGLLIGHCQSMPILEVWNPKRNFRRALWNLAICRAIIAIFIQLRRLFDVSDPTNWPIIRSWGYFVSKRDC